MQVQLATHIQEQVEHVEDRVVLFPLKGKQLTIAQSSFKPSAAQIHVGGGVQHS